MFWTWGSNGVFAYIYDYDYIRNLNREKGSSRYASRRMRISNMKMIAVNVEREFIIFESSKVMTLWENNA